MVGETFGNYEVVATLGKGGVGEVYLAQHRILARRAAIKVLAPELTKDRDVVKRFFLEALATSLIRHPGIVEILDYDVERSGRAYIVMEHLAGETLGACLERVGALPWQTACAVGNRIASAVGAAHAHGIVHRDLKPGNVFISSVVESSSPTERRIKILDFGLAKLLYDETREPITRAGMLLGTPMYISPEQCTAAGQVTHSTDVYALGCILFEMVCCRPPFPRDGFRAILAAHMFEPAPRVSSLVPAIPEWLDDLIARMLAKRPADRPASMAEVADALARAGRDETGLTWLLPSIATSLVRGVTRPLPAAPSFERSDAWQEGSRSDRQARWGRSLRVAGAVGGLAAAAVIGAFVLRRAPGSGHRAVLPAAALAASVVEPRTPMMRNLGSGLLTAVDHGGARESLAAPPTPSVPDAQSAIRIEPSDSHAPARRRTGEGSARRRRDSPRDRTLIEADGIIDL